MAVLVAVLVLVLVLVPARWGAAGPAAASRASAFDVRQQLARPLEPRVAMQHTRVAFGITQKVAVVLFFFAPRLLGECEFLPKFCPGSRHEPGFTKVPMSVCTELHVRCSCCAQWRQLQGWRWCWCWCWCWCLLALALVLVLASYPTGCCTRLLAIQLRTTLRPPHRTAPAPGAALQYRQTHAV